MGKYANGVSNDSSRSSSNTFPSDDNTAPSSTNDENEQFFCIEPASQIGFQLQELFSESCAGKIWRTAANLIPANERIDRFPEYVLSFGPTAGNYTTREAKFWTCGFFPGSLYCLLERSSRFPKAFPFQDSSINRQKLHDQLLTQCRRWSEPLHEMAFRTDTHDVGFIIMPALRQDWELTGNKKSMNSLLIAAESLVSRFDNKVGAIRSWNQCVSNRYHITDRETNFLVIIDSMCNLDLLFYAGYQGGNQRYIDIAISHARAVAKALIRPDNSTFHVCNFDPKTGSIQSQFTHQGYQDDSTWSRGQAWGILGFAQTYRWTKDPFFLSIATSLADHFIHHLRSATYHHPYVPLWDFDDSQAPYLRDTSAGMIAANGMLLLHQAIQTDGQNSSTYLRAAIRIAKETIDLSLADAKAVFYLTADGTVDITKPDFESILMNATANNNQYAIMRYKDHGLVYADYYFLEFGNKLLRMGLI
ncbi:glycoside hydrolase family 88 protein [Talaromyces proteolyticus]|uniref:Glycoside hydrolase family 88 protein n=1 Tax=Talaromyces proteolyticus TaxID=1131652 RepID=A0AAD4KFA3_9EURO|nr:glycoside hydrolase family 88 protein [Talaromyces proteolyticus]KAH8690627.1 glycoside hydrolase family 88 protein [Talaromyces proteolyticus]